MTPPSTAEVRPEGPLAPVARPLALRAGSGRIGPLTVERIVVAGRGPGWIAGAVAPGHHLLELALDGPLSVAQDGTTVRLSPGDIAIVEGGAGHRIGIEARVTRLSVGVPHRWLPGSPPGPAAPVGPRRIAGDAGVGAVLARALGALVGAEASFDGPTGAAVAEHLCGLAALAVAAEDGGSAAGAHDRLWRAALEHIERELGDPGLGPQVVADRIAVSPRLLHRLFADRGTTFGRTLRERRLHRARRLLADPVDGERSIADIAHRVGFRDPSYFARAFRERYGASPRRTRPRRG